MSLILVRMVSLLCLSAIGAAPLAAEKWQVQYFYDKAKSTFAIADLQFPSPRRGIAAGVIVEGSHREPTSVVTSDGGAHWQTVPLKDEPLSMFFLNEDTGWMVTRKGLWQTLEAGRSWTKLAKPPGDIIRVHFLSETHGFAVGKKKIALETQDGGKTWTRLAQTTAVKGENLNYSAYNCVAFANPSLGLIMGFNAPPPRFPPRLPDWIDPEMAVYARETPHVYYALQTSDGGKTWATSSGSVTGIVTRLRFLPTNFGLGVVQYNDGFRYPSEIFTVSPNADIHSLYRDPKFKITDVWLTPGGAAYMAGTVARGQLRSLFPSKVQVLASADLKNWRSIPVDYRAEAIFTILAGAGDRDLWMATDTGMILKLVP